MLTQQYKSLFLLFIWVFSSCTNGTPVQNEEKPLIIEENVEFPKFNNQDIFIKSTGIGIAHFNQIEKKLGLKSKNMYVCSGENYFIKENKYCLYFDELWVQNPIQTERGAQLLALTAKRAYADKIFEDFLFNQATFTIQNLDFILFSDIIRWQSKEHLLISPPKSYHIMKNKNQDILTGYELVLDYNSEYFTMQKVSLELQDNL